MMYYMNESGERVYTLKVRGRMQYIFFFFICRWPGSRPFVLLGCKMDLAVILIDLWNIDARAKHFSDWCDINNLSKVVHGNRSDISYNLSDTDMAVHSSFPV